MRGPGVRVAALGLASLLALAAGVATAEEPPLVGSVWRWSRVLGIDPLEVERPAHYTLELGEDGRWSARADCNRAGGTYTLEGERLVLEPGPATLAECGPGSHATRFLALLSEVRGLAWEDERLVLVLRGDQGAMELAAARRVLLPGTRWWVRAVNDGRGGVTSVLAGSALTLEFGVDGRLAGTAGCNGYGAGYELEGEALALGPAMSTRRACAEPAGVMQQEGAFLAALSRVARWGVEGERLLLRDADGALLVDAVAAVTGTLTYRVRRALPPDARVEVRLEDVSRADVPAVRIGAQRFAAEGAQVPLPFEVVFDPADVDPRHRYALRARIEDAEGRPLFVSSHSPPAITRDAPQFGIELVLDPAPRRPVP